jgi:hypothetical protein
MGVLLPGSRVFVALLQKQKFLEQCTWLVLLLHGSNVLQISVTKVALPHSTMELVFFKDV